MIPKKISKPHSGRRFAISDIHGCPQTFRALIQQIELQANDQLFLLGDFLDRGPDSGGVLDYIFELQSQNFQIFPLMGNHEEMFLDSYKKYSKALFIFSLKMGKCFNMLDENREIKPNYLNFLENLDYCYELDNCYLVHGGLNFELSNPWEDTKSMLWLRKFEVPVGYKRVIHGHVPTELQIIEESILNQSSNICIDNGCVYAIRDKHKLLNVEHLGNLCCLDLDSFELTTQAYIG